MIWTRGSSPVGECALLVAVPLDRDEFTADAARPTDFVRACAVARRHTDDPWTAYERYATRCREVAASAENHGVTVIRRATLDALSKALARCKTVTLLAHSRGPEIEARDVVDPAALMRHGREINERLEMSLEPPTGAPDARRVAAWLDAALGPVDFDAGPDTPDATAFAWRVAHYKERWHRRRAIEEVCPGALAGGPAVEFHGGLVKIEALNAALPRRFQTLDLTVCDSVLLAERLRANRAEGSILASPHPATPDFRLMVYNETIRYIARRGTPYEATAVQVRRYWRNQAPQRHMPGSAGASRQPRRASWGRSAQLHSEEMRGTTP